MPFQHRLLLKLRQNPAEHHRYYEATGKTPDRVAFFLPQSNASGAILPAVKRLEEAFKHRNPEIELIRIPLDPPAGSAKMGANFRVWLNKKTELHSHPQEGLSEAANEILTIQFLERGAQMTTQIAKELKSQRPTKSSLIIEMHAAQSLDAETVREVKNTEFVLEDFSAHIQASLNLLKESYADSAKALKGIKRDFVNKVAELYSFDLGEKKRSLKQLLMDITMNNEGRVKVLGVPAFMEKIGDHHAFSQLYWTNLPSSKYEQSQTTCFWREIPIEQKDYNLLLPHLSVHQRIIVE